MHAMGLGLVRVQNFEGRFFLACGLVCLGFVMYTYCMYQLCLYLVGRVWILACSLGWVVGWVTEGGSELVDGGRPSRLGIWDVW